MKKTCLSMLLMVLGIGFSGCSSPVNAPEGGELVRTEKVRDTAPKVVDGDLAELVAGNNRFAMDLYHKLSDGETSKNVFYSPYSISLALAMTYAGARNETESQMAQTLHFMEQDRLHPAFNALDLDLATRGQNAKGMDGQPMRLTIVNALWGQKDYTFLPAFLDTVGVNYGAGMRLVDFVGQPEESRKTINDWVSYYTEAKIPELIPAGMITGLTRLVLTNAIYFNAAWKYPFDGDKTTDGSFARLDGTKATVKMMHQTEFFKYAEDEGYQAVELPYDGEELSMVVFLPAGGTFSSFETALTPERMAGIVAKLGSVKVALTMPKFKLDYDLMMKAVLAGMGMSDAFGGSADFSGMTGNRDLMIAEVIHKAYVLVGEKGTEAAAATAVVMEVNSAPAPELVKVMTMDRPFIFLIRDIKTGSILFVGRMLNPAS